MASEDHGLAAVEAVGDDHVRSVPGRWVEADIGFVEKHKAPSLREDLDEIREPQVV